MPSPKFDVSVIPQFLPEQSDLASGPYTFAYFVTIKNVGDIAAQLIGRHWVIEDAKGNHQEVKGLGVVGQQPLLQPGESFTYNSGTQIASPVGSMHGTYICIAEDATVFEAQIPVFSLRAEGPEIATASTLH
ncbi:MAG: Co2+/Mg2+ efflux protein ApaG [Burkholderiaceae bacterium]|nr:Co2+/Mg2+ efflux protein ApaG [Burkholderiaceae bacterium]